MALLRFPGRFTDVDKVSVIAFKLREGTSRVIEVAAAALQTNRRFKLVSFGMQAFDRMCGPDHHSTLV